jgi:4-carboxymuconolactone decarboxylase
MIARLELPPTEAMTPEQVEVCSEVVAGRRGKVPSPMIAWIRHPELARRAQMLGEVVRFQTTLEPRLIELAVLICARYWTSHQVWTSHKRHALVAGLDAEIVGAIAARRASVFLDEREQLVFDLSTGLLQRHRVSEPLYSRAVATFGERGVVELVSIVGYYGLVSLTANAFELGLPGAIATELGDPDFAKGEGP